MPNEKELIEILLTNRGIKKEDWDKFLNPSYDDHLYDPFLMADMEKTCVRIFEAIEAKEKIAIYADYDCDGIPAAVIMNDFFEKISFKNFFIYIPDRHDEGYGLHHEAVEQFIKDEVRLLITFDLGITAIDEVSNATANGIDVIITDHHIPGGELPRAYAVLNPKVDKYPDKNICGAGVAYKLVQALVKKYGEYWKINNGWEKWLLDVAGVATLADQVPLLDENRTIAFYGLKVLRKSKRFGLIEIFNLAGTKIKNVNEEDVTFTLAPRINAASRMSDPMLAFKLLSTKDEKEAKNIAINLSKINDERKIMVAHIMKEIKSNLKKREEKEIIVIGNPSWRIGVLGIVASKVVEEYKKPAFVWGSDGSGLVRGSCRAYGEINLFDLMTSLPKNSLIEFGGHKEAGGFSVLQEEIHFLEERILLSLEKKLLSQNSETPEIYNSLKISEEENGSNKIDAIISLDDVNRENYKIIEKLAPFGKGNPRPLFLFKNIEIIDLREFGKDKNHLEIYFSDSKGKKIKAISFFKTRESFGKPLFSGHKVDLIASFEENTFLGKNDLRLRIVDMVI